MSQPGQSQESSGTAVYPLSGGLNARHPSISRHQGSTGISPRAPARGALVRAGSAPLQPPWSTNLRCGDVRRSGENPRGEKMSHRQSPVIAAGFIALLLITSPALAQSPRGVALNGSL